jgi:hypothetical protein
MLRYESIGVFRFQSRSRRVEHILEKLAAGAGYVEVD